jgi:hypothetical protein
MSKPITYTQCELSRPLERGTARQTSWIPTVHARVGQALRLRVGEDSWQEGWVVEAAWSTLPEAEVRKLSHLHALWRDHNDR